MNDSTVFRPRRSVGTVFFLFVIGSLLAISTWGIWNAIQTDIGPLLFIFILPAVFSVFLIPLTIYRLNSLQNAAYRLTRESIQLTWGLHTEEIPMHEVGWARMAGDLSEKLPLPVFRFPGAILGNRSMGTGRTAKFLASTTKDLVCIATNTQLYVISPENTDGFLTSFNRLMELGSLAPPPGKTVLASSFIANLWADLLSRILLVAGFVLGLGLFILVLIKIQQGDTVSMGYTNDLQPREPIPRIRMMLFPILNGFTYAINLILGLSLFRKEETRIYAYIMWSSAILAAVLFLVAAIITR